jgi:hypothetical protein
MFEEIENLLSTNELNFLQNKCNNFNITDTPYKNKNENNFYIRDMVDIKFNLIEYQAKIENYLFKKFNIKCKTINIFINKISNQTNKSDDYHRDLSNFTIITFLNDNFIGGEYVYLDNDDNSIFVKPKKNMCILQDNKLMHKVNPVSSGIRYSCITFLKYVDKNTKSLI